VASSSGKVVHRSLLKAAYFGEAGGWVQSGFSNDLEVKEVRLLLRVKSRTLIHRGEQTEPSVHQLK
jgi:hypothetical protein